MISYLAAIILGILQGITELFPVSSLGHSVLLPHVLHWNIKETDPFFLAFLVATHAATALVLFFFFLKDWKKVFSGMLRSLKKREIDSRDPYAKLGWLLVVGTIPAGFVGVLFQEQIQALFASVLIVSVALILNGCMLLLADVLQKNKHRESEQGSDQRIAKLSYIRTLKIGTMQCLALIPGFSRTGSTITAGLLMGLSHEDAARFSFLLATPIIGAAAFLKLPDLLNTSGMQNLGPVIVGAICAGVAAYCSVRFLTRYFETQKLWPFGVYCILAGGLVLLLAR